jgi:hypothetical protein
MWRRVGGVASLGAYDAPSTTGALSPVSEAVGRRGAWRFEDGREHETRGDDDSYGYADFHAAIVAILPATQRKERRAMPVTVEFDNKAHAAEVGEALKNVGQSWKTPTVTRYAEEILVAGGVEPTTEQGEQSDSEGQGGKRAARSK